MIEDGFPAYIEIRCNYGRLCGGTLDEINEAWEQLKYEDGACHSRLVLGDGTIVEERSVGSENLRQQVKRRLETMKWNDDAELIRKMGELLGMIDLPGSGG